MMRAKFWDFMPPPIPPLVHIHLLLHNPNPGNPLFCPNPLLK